MNITYLLGAGASFNALPTYNRKDDEFYESTHLNDFSLNEDSLNAKGEKIFDKSNFLHRLILFRKKYWGDINFEDEGSWTVDEETKTFLTDINWLISQLKLHVSIDTVAKKLYVTREDLFLNKLKGLVSCFFLHEQLTKHYDQRYDTFIASFAERGEKQIDFNKNIKVITWNYDIQFEVAFQNYSSSKEISSLQKVLNTFPSSYQNKFEENRFGIVRLNGVAGFLKETNGGILPLQNLLQNDKTIEITISLINYYTNYLNRPNSISDLFCYSWEKDSSVAKEALKYARKIFNNTDILIIIGYSFPYFNRETDNLLFLSLLNRLKKIYIQDPNAEEIKSILLERYLSHQINKNKMDALTNVKSFFIPTLESKNVTPLSSVI